MKMYKSILFLSILSLTSAPLLMYGMEESSNNNNNNNAITQLSASDEIIYKKLDTFNPELFETPTFEEFQEERPQTPPNTPTGLTYNQAILGATNAGFAALIYIAQNMVSTSATTRSRLGGETTRFMPLVLEATQGVLSSLQSVGFYAAIVAGAAYTYGQIKWTGTLEEKLRQHQRTESDHKAYIEKLIESINQRDRILRDTVQKEFGVLKRIHENITPLLTNGDTPKTKCNNCKKTAEIAKETTEYIAKKFTQLGEIHNEFPEEPLTGKTHTNPLKKFFQKLHDYCTEHLSKKNTEESAK